MASNRLNQRYSILEPLKTIRNTIIEWVLIGTVGSSCLLIFILLLQIIEYLKCRFFIFSEKCIFFEPELSSAWKIFLALFCIILPINFLLCQKFVSEYNNYTKIRNSYNFSLKTIIQILVWVTLFFLFAFIFVYLKNLLFLESKSLILLYFLDGILISYISIFLTFPSEISSDSVSCNIFCGLFTYFICEKLNSSIFSP